MGKRGRPPRVDRDEVLVWSLTHLDEKLAATAQRFGVSWQRVQQILKEEGVTRAIPGMCRAGIHAMTPENSKKTKGGQRCRACQNSHARLRRREKKQGRILTPA